jgi:hypothetical protein
MNELPDDGAQREEPQRTNASCQIPPETRAVNWTGGRTVLIINVCTLIVAGIMTVEAAYIHYHFLGRFLWDDYLICLLPAFVPLIVRDARCSSVFLFFYVGFATVFGVIARSIYTHTYNSAGVNDPLFPLLFFDLISIACLVIYVAVISIHGLIRILSSRSVR